MKKGYFGEYGGCFVPELLLPPLQELRKGLEEIVRSPSYQEEFQNTLRDFVGRPTPLTYCANLSRELGFSLWLKREDLAHTGAHKINNTLGQAILAKRMGKTRLLAETGAGQHGVATATAAALLGLDCLVFMGAKDVQRQSVNVRRMQTLGARVESVTSSTQTLKDAINASLRYWIAHQETTHYCLGSVTGPDPFPELIRELQSVIGSEAREQFLAREGQLPDQVVACVGGGSNALGVFSAFLQDKEVGLTGVEAAGSGEPGCFHSATLSRGTPGVLHGSFSYLLQSPQGQVSPSHSLAPGLDYPGVGPEHSHLRDSARVRYITVNDEQAYRGFKRLSSTEGIIPALESAHALAGVLEGEAELGPQSRVLINLSGRGDKDLEIVIQYEDEKSGKEESHG